MPVTPSWVIRSWAAWPAWRSARAGSGRAEALAERLAGSPIRALYSSPLERARATAAALAGRLRLEVQIADELNEIDYVQGRMLRLVERLCSAHPEGTVALVSHGDVIKATLAHYLGVSLDLFQRIEISPASLSIVRIGRYGPEVLLLNSGVEELLLQA
jgi:probable phosphoglycerate mutase